MKHPVVMPHLGATGGDVRIVEWRASESDFVAAGAVLLVVETDKSVVEVEAFRAGRLAGPLAAEGFVAPGSTIGYLSDGPAGAAPVVRVTSASEEAARTVPVLEEVGAASAPITPKTLASPAAGENRAARVSLRLAGGASASGGAALAERLVEAFSTMMLIRRYEDHLYQLFLQGLVPGTLHQCQGQEAVAVGACSALRRDDLIYWVISLEACPAPS
jgi:pyruvate/2-oxoglutarate dehydrogenase complex dihydrolipoamide acyltransferase (E2) component